jgi:rRNA small subunit pseudouridine methyltransferase Nep1
LPLNVILAESALELMPSELYRHPAVANDAKRRNRQSAEILLDRSKHHDAMLKLYEGGKRGRPDLVHTAVLSVTATPLFEQGKAKVYIHTRSNVVLELAPRLRPPKSYLLFRNLMEKVLLGKESSQLFRVHAMTLARLLRMVVKPDYVVGLSTQGAPMKLERVAEELHEKHKPAVLIGGFPHGHFSADTLKLVDQLARIHDRPLEAHTVASRLVYEYEKLQTDNQE